MASNLKSFTFAIGLHFFIVVFLLLFQKQQANLNSFDKNIKLIRLVSFGSGSGGYKNLTSSKKSNTNSTISSNSNITTISQSSNAHKLNNENSSAKGIVQIGGNGQGNGNGNDISNGINPTQATALEIEVNKLRVYLQKYLDQKLDSKNINFNIQLTLNKTNGVTGIEVLTDQLSSKQVYLIKRIISSYQHQDLISHLPSSSMKILIPIKIIEG